MQPELRLSNLGAQFYSLLGAMISTFTYLVQLVGLPLYIPVHHSMQVALNYLS
jgi:hypothetical protein